MDFDILPSENVIHQDVKPANILIDEYWDRVADFGLSRFDGRSHGTPLRICMARETLEEETRATKKVDVFAFGLTILYEILVGESVFPRNADSFRIASMHFQSFDR
jgi:serine/threonine protein kinase